MSDNINRDSLAAAVIALEEGMKTNTEMLHRIESVQREVRDQTITNANKLEVSLTWQVKHEASDEIEFGKIAGKLDELREFKWKLMGGVVVAGAIMGVVLKLWK